jgi:hypothetical protein
MTQPQTTASIDVRQEPCEWTRLDTAGVFADFSDPFTRPVSQRQHAMEHGIPRSTLGYWLNQDYPDHLDPDFVRFFRCPAGEVFLRRMVLALLLVFHQQNPCGLRQIGTFLELVELDHFVASSYGALYDLDQHLQQDLAVFAKQQRASLALAMAPKDIVLCPDENFHGPAVCLVGIEPVSNFILVEVYAERRDSATWAKAIEQGCEGLPVNVVALTSDCASGLIRCAEVGLEVRHQPELWHLQHELSGPILLPLARPIQQAHKDLEKAQQRTDIFEQAERERPGSVGLDVWVPLIRAELLAEQSIEQARQVVEQAVEQVRDISRVYHPFDRDSGQPVTAEQVQQRLQAPVDKLAEMVEEHGLGQRAFQAVAKAQQWLVVLSGYVAWFWAMAENQVEKLDLSDEVNQQILGKLLASYYWEMASSREKEPDEQKRLKALAEQLRQQAWACGGALAGLSEADQEKARQTAQQCAGLFCRSSSCVEGRNGRLSLFHHGQTRLSSKRLKALTVVHNYVVKRADGTTAAERFFGQKHPDAFSWLLQRLPDLPRPAAKRRQRAAAATAPAA